MIGLSRVPNLTYEYARVMPRNVTIIASIDRFKYLLSACFLNPCGPVPSPKRDSASNTLSLIINPSIRFDMNVPYPNPNPTLIAI